MRLYGLTGGIGSGKSEVARRFGEHGIPVINADAIGHEVIEPGGAAFAELAREFGEDILVGGRIEHARLADKAFSDPDKRRRLNEITHPAIYAEIGRRCAALAEEGAELAVVEAALLCEDGKPNPLFEGLILVSCPEEIRIQRLVEQRGMSREEAARRIAAQRDPEAKSEIAAWIIDNDGDYEQLFELADVVADDLRQESVLMEVEEPSAKPAMDIMNNPFGWFGFGSAVLALLVLGNGSAPLWLNGLGFAAAFLGLLLAFLRKEQRGLGAVMAAVCAAYLLALAGYVTAGALPKIMGQ